MVIFDNHFHLRTERWREWVREFLAAGGTHLLLTHAPYDDQPVRSAADYTAVFERTLRTADLVRRETAAKVFVALGPYPVELVHLGESMGLDAAKEALLAGMESAARHVRDGRAVALGEIGRPHFAVTDAVWRASNEVLEHGMRLAKEAGCAVVLHTEDPTAETFAEWAAMADRIGLSPRKVVKHHSAPLVAAGERTGIWPSLLAKEDGVTAALREGTRFLLETDFMDDPKRPGAVLGPATVPRKTRLWRERGLLTEEAAHQIHVENPRRVYGIEVA